MYVFIFSENVTKINDNYLLTQNSYDKCPLHTYNDVQKNKGYLVIFLFLSQRKELLVYVSGSYLTARNYDLLFLVWCILY